MEPRFSNVGESAYVYLRKIKVACDSVAQWNCNVAQNICLALLSGLECVISPSTKAFE